MSYYEQAEQDGNNQLVQAYAPRPARIRKGDRVLFEGVSVLVTSVTSLTAGGPMASFELDGATRFARTSELVEDMRTGSSTTPTF